MERIHPASTCACVCCAALHPASSCTPHSLPLLRLCIIAVCAHLAVALQFTRGGYSHAALARAPPPVRMTTSSAPPMVSSRPSTSLGLCTWPPAPPLLPSASSLSDPCCNQYNATQARCAVDGWQPYLPTCPTHELKGGCGAGGILLGMLLLTSAVSSPCWASAPTAPTRRARARAACVSAPAAAPAARRSCSLRDAFARTAADSAAVTGAWAGQVHVCTGCAG
jgi:hypothetical protein